MEVEATNGVDRTNTGTLDELLARLAAHDLVDGILLLGSSGTGEMTPTSDYDLLLVLRALPAPLRMVATSVDGRLTEIYCSTVHDIDRITAPPTAWPTSSEEQVVVDWLRNGRIVHDREGRLAAAQERARRTPRSVDPPADDVYEIWRKVGYNVAHMKRYLVAEDPVSQIAVDIRLLYSLIEVVTGYFGLRSIPWRGEKAAIRHWETDDPGYLRLLRACLAETDRQRKVALYEELARLTVVPVGELWSPAEAAVSLGAGYAAGTNSRPAGTVADALAFWQTLVSGGASERTDDPRGRRGR